MIFLLDIGRVNVNFRTVGMGGVPDQKYGMCFVLLLFGYQIADKPLQCCVGGFYSQQLQGCQPSKPVMNLSHSGFNKDLSSMIYSQMPYNFVRKVKIRCSEVHYITF